MTITFIDLYNDITGQAWSMFDGEVESKDEFETTVTTSIQKALSDLWLSYKFPFRSKTKTYKTKENKSEYVAPNGNIQDLLVNNKLKFKVKCDGSYLTYEDDYYSLEDTKNAIPTKFYVENDVIYLYPTPDSTYTVTVGYWNNLPCCDADGVEKVTLEEDTDYINIPEKYEQAFKHTLMTLAMVYLIASEQDENYAQYYEQYKIAYSRLLNICKGIDKNKKIGW